MKIKHFYGIMWDLVSFIRKPSTWLLCCHVYSSKPNLVNFKCVRILDLDICILLYPWTFRNDFFFFVSQNTDASLLLSVSWPALAINEDDVRMKTIEKVLRKLKGNFGIKHFPRDRYKTAIEDKNRKYYRPAEIKVWV